MSKKPVKVVVDLSKPKGERESIVELTDDEIAEMKAMAAEAEAERVAEAEAQAELEANKQSAKDKLASLGLTEAEVIALLGN